MSKARRRSRVVANHPQLSMTRQCQLLSISRGSLYYTPRGENDLNLRLMREIDEQYLKTPWYGTRQMVRHLKRIDYQVGRKRIRRLMRTLNAYSGRC